jgi:hypothetical protein
MFFPGVSLVADAGNLLKRPLLQIDRAEAEWSSQPTPEAWLQAHPKPPHLYIDVGARL